MLQGAGDVVDVLDRAMLILEVLADTRRRMTIREISEATGVPRSSVHRIVRRLASRNYVMASEPGGYRLGPGVLKMALNSQHQLVAPMRPVLATLAQRLNENVDLAVFNGRDMVVVDQVATSQRVQMVTRIGRPFSLHASSIGKIVLAQLHDNDIRALLPHRLDGFTPNTIREIDGLLSEIELVRANGIAFDNEEHDLGISAVATAIRGPGDVLHALSVVAPTGRFRQRRSVFVDALKAVPLRL